MWEIYKLLVGETDKVIENEVLNVLPSKIMHQKKVSQELSNRINVLTTFSLSTKIDCLVNYDIFIILLVLQNMEKVFVEKFNVQTVSLLLMLIILKL